MLTIHKASAGSGKTFQLTLKYITLLLGQPDESGKLRLFKPSAYGFCKPKAHGRILAITFTNKATQEMTNRIIKELSILANPTDGKQSPYIDNLCKAFAATPQQVSDAAHLALADLLYNFSWFNVSTIDAFFQKVLRIFANELDLPEQFNLEISEEYPVALAVAKMISSVNVNPAGLSKEDRQRQQRLVSWLQQYMDINVEEGRESNILSPSSNINRELRKTISDLRDETFRKNEKLISSYIDDPAMLANFVDSMRAHLAREKNTLKSMASALLAKTDGGALLTGNFLKIVTACQEERADKIDVKKNGTLPKVSLDGTVAGKKADVARWAPGTADDCQRLADACTRYYWNNKFYGQLIRQSYIIGLFGEACRRLHEYCLENEAFLLGDTNSLLRAVINDSDVPFVYERLGQVLNHFLIDEFQDTSEMQWANLRPLVAESLSRGQSDLIIGDVKQCIYRFRNSNPELLNTIVAQEASAIADVEIKGNQVAENTNWRSTREVVVFNNTLFTRIPHLIDRDLQTTVATTTYSGVIQQVAPKNLTNHGYVKVFYELPPASSGVTAPEPAAPDSAVVAPDSAVVAPDPVLEPMAREIERQLAAGYLPKDICILVYRHFEGEKVIDYLMALMNEGKWNGGRKVNIISADSMSISSSTAVQMIVAILRLITTPEFLEAPDPDANPTENPAYRRNRLIHRFQTLAAGLPDAPEADTPEAAISEPESPESGPVEAFARALAELDPDSGIVNEKLDSLEATLRKLASLECPNLFAVTEEIVRLLLPAGIRREQAAFISAFQDFVLEFSESGDNDILSFLKWWDTKKDKLSLPAPEGMNALSVMTIHKSKGLEFPCVHIPYTTTELVRYKGIGWYSLDPSFFPDDIRPYVPKYIPLTHKAEYESIPAMQKAARAYILEHAIDALNQIYVACTRAGRELCIYLGRTGKSNSNTIATLIHNALTDSFPPAVTPDALPWIATTFGPFTESPDSPFATLEFGTPTQPATPAPLPAPASAAPASAPAPSVSTPASPVSTPASPVSIPVSRARTVVKACGFDSYPPTLPSFDAEIDYDNILDDYSTSQSRMLTVDSSLDEMGYFNPKNERHIGNFLHDALAGTHRLEDFPEALRRAAHARNVPAAFWQQYEKPIADAIADPAIKPWFTDFTRVFRERSLTDGMSDVIRRPDRVVWMPDGSVVVIDYKFGKEEAKYKVQVKYYMSLLASYGIANLRGYLFFPLNLPDSRLIPVL